MTCIVLGNHFLYIMCYIYIHIHIYHHKYCSPGCWFACLWDLLHFLTRENPSQKHCFLPQIFFFYPCSKSRWLDQVWTHYSKYGNMYHLWLGLLYFWPLRIWNKRLLQLWQKIGLRQHLNFEARLATLSHTQGKLPKAMPLKHTHTNML